MSIDVPIDNRQQEIDPRVSELIGFADACRQSGLSFWTLHNAYRRGEIRGVRVPGGAVGLLRDDVDTFVIEYRERLKQRREKEAQQTS